jgi:hypothetical protein
MALTIVFGTDAINSQSVASVWKTIFCYHISEADLKKLFALAESL